MEISKKNKYTIGLIMVILAVVSGFFMIRELTAKEFKEEEKNIFVYKSDVEWAYNVHLKENTIFEDKILDQGNIYISEFVEEIENKIILKYDGHGDELINGQVVTKIVLDGVIGEDEKKIWSKEFLVEEKKIKDITFKSESEVTLSEFNINMDKFNKIIQDINKITKLNSKVYFHVDFHMQLHAETRDGEFEKTHKMRMDINMKNGYFEVMGELRDHQETPIKETVRVEVKGNRKVLFATGFGMFLGIIGLVFIIFMCRTVELSEKEKALKSIFNEYGDKMVAVTKFTAEVTQDTISVRDMKDLVRISDEMIKPILYKHSSNEEEIEEFFILSDNVYVYKLPKLTGDNEDDIAEKRNREEEEIIEVKVSRKDVQD